MSLLTSVREAKSDTDIALIKVVHLAGTDVTLLQVVYLACADITLLQVVHLPVLTSHFHKLSILIR